jgi:glycosyltransferase involved in cell wall biosynthesis
MRIGIFTTEFPYKPPFINNNSSDNLIGYGGVAEVTYNIALKLEESGHDVLIFTTSASSKDEYYQHKNVSVYRYAHLVKIGSTGISLKLLWRPLRHRLDIVNGHRGSPPGAISAFIYSKINQIPLILSIHGNLAKQASFNQTLVKGVMMHLFKEYIYTPMLAQAKCITVLSKQAAQESTDLHNICKKIRIVPNGVNLDKLQLKFSKYDCRKLLSLPQHAPMVLYVGSIVEGKGLQVLVKAIPLILKRYPDALFVFIGDGNYLDRIKQLSSQMHIEDSICFAGFIDGDKKLMYYQAADIFCLPSFSEGYPMVLLEASAFGLPLVVSDIEVHKAIVVDGYNGYMFKKGDFNDLAIKILDLMGDNQLMLDMGSNSRMLAQRHSWGLIVKKLEDVFLESIKDVDAN